MVSLSVVLLIFISSTYRNANIEKSALAFDFNTNSSAKNDGGLEETTQTRVNNQTLRGLKPLEENPKGQQQQKYRSHNSEEGRGLGSLKGEDDEDLKKTTNAKTVKISEEPKEERTTKENGPMPLYSLVKNVCEEGYIMDQNGVCQKAIVLRTGKEFDTERKKRFVRYEEFMVLPNWKPFFESINEVFPYRQLLDKFKQSDRVNCEEIYPGLVSDGNGGCRKSTPTELEPSKRFLFQVDRAHT